MPKVKEVSGCQGCPLAEKYPTNEFIGSRFPEAGKDLVRLVIDEAPRKDDIPRWMDKVYSRAGIDKAGLTQAHCISCVPPDHIFPTDPKAKYLDAKSAKEAVNHCLTNHLYPLLSSRNWKRIDLLGDEATSRIGALDGGAFKWRGSPVAIPDTASRGVITLDAPQIVINQEMFPVVVNDLLKSLEEPPEYYTPFPSLEDVRNFKFERFAFDIECPKYKLLGDSAPAEMVGLCARPNFALCVPITGAYIPELKRIFRAAKEVVGHNCIQFDLPKLRDIDIETNTSCIVYDTMLLQHLLFPTFPHDLEFVGSQFVSKPAWKDQKECLQTYCCRDTDVTWQSFMQLLQLVKKEHLLPLYLNVQWPLGMICHLMSSTGFQLDPFRISIVREKLLKEQAIEEQHLPEFLRTYQKPVRKRVEAPEGAVGKSGRRVKYLLSEAFETTVPWRSTEVKKRYLYGQMEGGLGLTPILDAKTGRVTTGKAALGKIFTRTGNRAVKALEKLNKNDELLTTFAKEDVAPRGKVHPSFNVHGTSSGRLSSSGPNCQNIPESARYMYVPSHPGWRIASVDFSGIENRIQSWLAGDIERSRRMEVAGFSEHKYLASKISGIPMDQIEKSIDPDSDYSKAKHVVHGVDRGLGYLKAARMYDLDLKEARKLFEIWKAEIKLTILWQNKCGEEAKKKGVLVNPFGRKLWLWTSSYYTEALSFLPQSTGADVIYRAMIGLMYERIGWPEDRVRKVVRTYKPLPKPAELLLQVHDELVFSYPAEIEEEVLSTIRLVMGQFWPELGGMVIPVGVNTSSESWGECQ